MDALLPAALAARLAGVSKQVINNWRNRGLLQVAADAQGNELRRDGKHVYRVRDILTAEALAAERCEKLAGRTAVRNPSGIAA
jgi:hypothetical protein